MPKISALIGISLMLVGCATPYQPKGFRGGYDEVEVKPGVYFLTFEGNGYTDSGTVMKYWHQRTKKLCEQRGLEVDVLSAEAANQIAGAFGYQPSLTRGGFGSVNIIRKPTHPGYIQCVRPPRGAEK
jgi:hypothetical protein